MNPAFRDHRKYSEVLLGKQNLGSNENEESKAIPICFTLNGKEDRELVKMMEQVVIVENTEVLNLEQTVKKVAAVSKSVKSMYSLSPTKMLIVFVCNDDAKNIVSMDSSLWNIFDDIRLWSEGEMFDDRLVWIECYGIHPKCWTMDNTRMIG